MRRHGWALCLGAILTGTAAAQPPASEDRFPPAPDLPGELVSQLPGSKPATIADPKDARPTPPAAAPLPDGVLAPYTSTATTTVVPVAPAAAPVPGAPCPAPPGKSGCTIGYGDIKEWLLFRSKSRQSGHFVTPYRPPLQAWFPCEPKPLGCGVGGPGCVGGGPGPVIPGTTIPMRGGALPAPVPAEPVAADPGLAGGMPVGKCLDAEVLTNFMPVAPGVGFTPGVAPMASPTTQVRPTSFKPK